MFGQRKNAKQCMPPLLPPHMFKVAPFASMPHPFLTSRAQAQVQGFREHLGALQGMQAYYAAQRAKAPAGPATPQVQQEDWKLAEEILNVLTSFHEFQQLPQQLRDSIEALKPLLGQSGQARYSAWTTMCRVLANGGLSASSGSGPIAAAAPSSATPNSSPSAGHFGQQAWARPPAPPTRQVSAPAAAPQRKPAVSFQGAGSPAQLPTFRGLLAHMTGPGILMEKDMNALAKLCYDERIKPGGWSNQLISLMGRAGMALINNDQDCRDRMKELLARLDLEYPPA